MFDGAKMILPEIAGRYIDPLSLLKGQTEDVTGFIMVSYQLALRTPDCEQGVPGKGAVFYDLYFFASSEMLDFARLGPDLRGFMDVRTGLQTFSVRRREAGTRVRLYGAEEESLLRFMTTFCCEPTLRIDLEGTGEDRLRKLLSASGCRRGIIECSEFKCDGPSFRFAEISSRVELRRFSAGSARGRLLLYDLEKNAGIYGPRLGAMDRPVYMHPALFRMSGKVLNTVGGGNRSLSPPGSLRRRRKTAGHAFIPGPERLKEAAGAGEVPGEASRRSEALTPCAATGGGAVEASPADGEKVPSVETEHPGAAPDAESSAAPDTPGEACVPPGREDERPAGGMKAAPAPGAPAQAPIPDEYIRQFDRLCRCFKKAVVDCLGRKGREVIAAAEEEVRVVAGGFDSGAMDREHARFDHVHDRAGPIL